MIDDVAIETLWHSVSLRAPHIVVSRVGVDANPNSFETTPFTFWVPSSGAARSME